MILRGKDAEKFLADMQSAGPLTDERRKWLESVAADTRRASDGAQALYDYFQQNWNREPYPVIEHTLRIDRLPDGTFHFYIHPSSVDGVTTDFIVSEHNIKLRPTICA